MTYDFSLIQGLFFFVGWISYLPKHMYANIHVHVGPEIQGIPNVKYNKLEDPSFAHAEPYQWNQWPEGVHNISNVHCF